MEIEDLLALKDSFNQFCREFEDCSKTWQTRRHMRNYLQGQLSDLERKSVEPMALWSGVPPRTMQEFLEIHRWDQTKAARRLRELVQKRYGDRNAIAVVDETSFAKKGKNTVGVQRQHCGSTGKVDNCVVTVHLGFVVGPFHTMVDGDLFLPQETWAADPERRRKARIPENIAYRPKWRIALDLLRRTRADGVTFKWLTADELYGRVMEFRDEVDLMGLTYVVEIPANMVGWTSRPEIEHAGTTTESGRVLRSHRVSPQAEKPRPGSQLWNPTEPGWKAWQIKETEKGPLVWRVLEKVFYPNVQGFPGEPLRLMIAQEVLNGEVKYFLSNAVPEIPQGEVLHVAFSRWNIERIFEDGKGEVGLDHFEVRNYIPLMRHLTLSMLSFFFLADQTEWLKKKVA